MTVHLTEHKETKVVDSRGVFKVMHQILLREEENDISREHFWVISLLDDNQIMNIELISLGSMSATIVEPVEVFSVPLQKKAAKIILVHNHPSGELIPSFDDKDITNRLIQCGKIMKCPVIDHLVITTENYFSFADTGLLAELEKSTKYAIDLSAEKYNHWKKNENTQLATKMIMRQRLDLKDIEELTDIPLNELEKMREKLLHKTK